jgi:hypothetical protein
MATSQDIFVDASAPVLVFSGVGLVHIQIAPGLAAPNNGPIYLGGPDVTPATGLPVSGLPYRVESTDEIYAIAHAGFDGRLRVLTAR